MSKKVLILFVGFLLCIGIIAVPGLIDRQPPDTPDPKSIPTPVSTQNDLLDGLQFGQTQEEEEPDDRLDEDESIGPLHSDQPQEGDTTAPVIKGEYQFFGDYIPRQIMENTANGFTAVTDSTPPNHELQTYLPEQTSFSKNHVTMKAEYTGEHYVSGKVESRYLFRYGTFSFKITAPKGVGLFPAIWMLPEDGTDFPEVDIYEMIGNHPENVYGVMHFMEPGKTEKSRDFFKHVIQDTIPDSYTLRFEWTREHMVWYLDDQQLYTIDHHVPEIPMYMIMNLAVGGDWPGDPDSQTVFPASFDVELTEFRPEEIFIR